ncbi:MAG TPA: bifunctional folylpolyglutamate synthase/dihydrofolate synthase, partial [Burkholderiaceae bacterium]
AVFGAMADKDVAPMLARMYPLVEHWYFSDLPTPRAASAAQLLQKWQAVRSTSKPRPDIGAEAATTFASPMQALHAAIAAADPADRIVVFGSFFTVGGVLKEGVPRLDAQHLGRPQGGPT